MMIAFSERYVFWKCSFALHHYNFATRPFGQNEISPFQEKGPLRTVGLYLLDQGCLI